MDPGESARAYLQALVPHLARLHQQGIPLESLSVRFALAKRTIKALL